MKNKIVSLNTNYWADKTITCPYECIKEVFTVAGISDFKNDINDYFLYARRNEVFSEKFISSVMYNSVVIQSALKSTYNIYLKPKRFKKLELVNNKVFGDIYCLSSLSKEECVNPYLALKNVFDKVAFDNIEITLFDTIRYAMSPSIDECFQDNFVQIPTYYKLLEACWLINERLKENE